MKLLKENRGFDDQVVISTYNRPQLVFNQIASFVENMLIFSNDYHVKNPYCFSNMPEKYYKARRVLFVIINDSDTSFEKGYLQEIKKICNWIVENKLMEEIKKQYDFSLKEDHKELE